MKIIHILSASLLFICISAQSQSRLNNTSKGIIYDREVVAEARLHTFGWSASYSVGKIKTYYKTTFWRFGLGVLKHPKEEKRNSELLRQNFSNSLRSYTFGKQNYGFMARVGYGMKRYYTEKAEKNGVALAVTYSGGLTAALLKPYYIEVELDSRVPKPIRYSAENSQIFLGRDATKPITGRANLFTGVGETSVIPGIHGQVGVHLDWGAFDEFLRGVEAGIMVDVFPKKLPIMVNEQNKLVFINLYLSLQIGKRN
jgi:hypothetical protein